MGMKRPRTDEVDDVIKATRRGEWVQRSLDAVMARVKQIERSLPAASPFQPAAAFHAASFHPFREIALTYRDMAAHLEKKFRVWNYAEMMLQDN